LLPASREATTYAGRAVVVGLADDVPGAGVDELPPHDVTSTNASPTTATADLVMPRLRPPDDLGAS
jgi:hypothetical protein